MTIIIMMIAAAAAWYNIVYECSELEKLWGLRTPALTARRAGRYGLLFSPRPSFLQCTFEASHNLKTTAFWDDAKKTCVLF